MSTQGRQRSVLGVSRVIGLFDNDPVTRTDRVTSGLAEFPGRRHLGFTRATRLVLCQRVQILGRRCQLGGRRTKLRLPLPAGTPSPAGATPVTSRQVWRARSRAARCALAVKQ
jgi:hypothetical protein